MARRTEEHRREHSDRDRGGREVGMETETDRRIERERKRERV